MCDNCSNGLTRRQFMAGTSLALSALPAAIHGTAAAAASVVGAEMAPRKKTPAVVKAVFLYPLPEQCDAGKAEAGWQEHHWHPYPGNQYRHAEQQQKFTAKVLEMAKRIGIALEISPQVLSTDAEVDQYIASVSSPAPDALLMFCLSAASDKKAQRISQSVDAPAIVYLPTGAHHHLPPAELRNVPGIHFIHSIENWEEIERSLRAVHAKKMLAQSRVLRVGNYPERSVSTYGPLGTEVVCIPAAQYNDLFDSIAPDAAMKAAAMQFKARATEVMDVTDEYCVEAFRAHKAVKTLLGQYAADAITILCLMLQHRKPCVSFSINNGDLAASCGCENDIAATMTMLLNRHLFDRPGFQHNSEYDEVRNHYFATHCTCATTLAGPGKAAQPFKIRPFFHHLPKTPALDVQWTPGAPVILAKLSTKPEVQYFTGKVIGSPSCPPTGGCATRVLVDFAVDDVTSVYMGSHPVLMIGTRDDARCYAAFARLFERNRPS